VIVGLVFVTCVLPIVLLMLFSGQIQVLLSQVGNSL
jgi:hypothetical protein